MTTRLLFVCSGNICRSPTAEAVMRARVAQLGLQDEIEVDGAGTGGWHVGDPPDARATEAARRRGVELTGRARQVERADFEDFDLILAVDEVNLHQLRRVAPRDALERVRKLTGQDVPDPYYGGPGGFDRVLDMIEEACDDLLRDLGYPLPG